MNSSEKDQLSVYLVFAEPSGEFVQAARSLVGAGYAVVRFAARERSAVHLVIQDGGRFEIDAVAAQLPMDGTVQIRAADGAEPIVRIERRFLTT